MTVEVATYPNQLNTTLPTSADVVSEGDDHLRLIKTVVKTTFPNFGGAFTATHTEANYLVGVTSNIQTQFTGKANTDSPVFTTAATLPAATTIGTVTAAEILRLSGVTSPIQTQLNAKGALAGQVWTGSHSFTGATITVPTVTAGDSSNNAASTAFVAGTAFASALPGQSASTVGMFPRSDGTSAAWAYPILFQNFISTTSSALKGFNNVITAGGITVTLPTLAVNETCEITNASNTVTPVVDWGTAKYRNQPSPGAMTLNTVTAGFRVIGTGNATVGYI